MNQKKTLLLTTMTLAVPNILQQLVTNLSQMVDNLMVGGLQEHAIAGVTITNQVFFVFTIALFGVGSAAGIFIPQFKGVGNEKKMTEVFQISLLFSILTGIIFFLIMTFAPDVVFRLFATDPETLAMGHSYLRYISFAFLVFPVSLAITNGFRFSGLVRVPLYIALITVAVNVFFNFGLIFGNFGMPAMGVAGAGLATLIARIVEMLISIGLTIYLKSPVVIKIKGILRPEKKLTKLYIKKGYGLVFNEFFWATGMQLLTVIYTQRISANIAAMSISTAITNMIFIGMGGMSVAISLILGEHLGKGEFQEAKDSSKKLLRISAFVGLAQGIIVLFLSFFIITLYDVSPTTIAMARYVIFIHVAFSWVYYWNAGYFFILRAGGDTKSVLLMDAGFNWVVLIPLAFLIGRAELALPVHFFLVQLIEFGKLGVARFVYKKDTWLNNLTVAEN